MITLPSDVPVPMRPLAWLLGRWQGFGTLVQPTLTPNSQKLTAKFVKGSSARLDYVVVQASFGLSEDGKKLVQKMRFFHAEPAGESIVAVSMSASDGLDLLVPGDLWWEESTPWTLRKTKVASGDDPASSLSQCATSGQVTTFSTSDLGTVADTAYTGDAVADSQSQASEAPIQGIIDDAQWVAQSRGPQILMNTVHDCVEPLTRIDRSFGLVSGELMIAQDLFLEAQEFSEWGIRMEKVSLEGDLDD